MICFILLVQAYVVFIVSHDQNIKPKINNNFCIYFKISLAWSICINWLYTNSEIFGCNFKQKRQIIDGKILDHYVKITHDFSRVQNHLTFVCSSGGLKFCTMKVSCVKYLAQNCIFHAIIFISVGFFIYLVYIMKIQHLR